MNLIVIRKFLRKAYLNPSFRSGCIMLIFIIGASLITYFLYIYTQNLLKERLKDKIVGIAATATTAISVEDVEKVYDASDLESKNLKILTSQLTNIREKNPNIKYAYIMRKSSTAAILQFVADADSLVPASDSNGNGVIDPEEENPIPGDLYDASPYPSLNGPAFERPIADENVQSDQWGLLMAGYAPIFDANKNVKAILGIDIYVTEYLKEIRATLLPFSLFIVCLILMLALLTQLLIRFWNERVEILKELDRQKDELLGIVAHQLAKPITAIRWDLESLLDGDLGQMNDEQKKEAALMRGQAVNLADLVSMILDVSRIQLGKMQFEPQPLDLNQFFTEILEVVQPTIEQKKLKFIKKMPKTLPTVLLDKRYTRMTVENLLTNAVKYTPDGGTVTLDLAIEKGIMHCSVADTGCGIPKEDQGKIFGKMFRASNVRNTVDGNGFGLYVAKGAIEGQGGKMWFESAVGKGTTFSFELPVKEVGKS